MNLDAKLTGILLEPEQLTLLATMVEADQRLPRDQRDVFVLFEYDQGSVMEHKGLVGKLTNVHPPDLRTLVSCGLLDVTYNEHGTALYSITPLGSAYYRFRKEGRTPRKSAMVEQSNRGQQVTLFRVFIASPSDCAEERSIIPDVLHQWNALHSFAEAVCLEPVKWETHSAPEMGSEPQSIINKRLLEISDMMIAVFRQRLGTPTSTAESGTAEEIKRFVATGKPTMVYFSKAPVQYESIDHSEFERLKKFKDWCKSKGLLGEYSSIENLREQLVGHVALTVERLRQKWKSAEREEAEAQGGATNSVERSSTPDQLTKEPDQQIKSQDAEEASKIEIPAAPASFLPERLELLELLANRLWGLLSHPGVVSHREYLDTMDLLTNQMLPQVSELMNYPAFGRLVISFANAAKETVTYRSRAEYFTQPSKKTEMQRIAEFKKQHKLLMEGIRSLKGSNS